MLTWAAGQATGLDHRQREKVLSESGRELQRRRLEATFEFDCLTGEFCACRALDTPDAPAGDVLMMQADGMGIALRPEHRKNGQSNTTHPGIKKMA
jgi:hypothetical protein